MLNTTTFTEDPNDPVKLREKTQGQRKSKCNQKNTMFLMHNAAKNGKVSELKALLEKGSSDLWQIDSKGRTPLHYACGYAQQKTACKMVEAILNNVTAEDIKTKRKLVDFQDMDGDTALHIAAKVRHPEVAVLLLCENANVNIKNGKDGKGDEQLKLIFEKLPSTMRAVYDVSVSCTEGQVRLDDDSNVSLTFDFDSIVGTPMSNREELQLFYSETMWLSKCLGLSLNKQKAILTHPVVQLFLYLKWKKIRVLLWISIVYHIFWLLLYTYFNVNLYSLNCPYKYEIISDRRKASSCKDWNQYGLLLTSFCILLLMTLSIIGKEVYEIYRSEKKKRYFQQLENIGQWLVVGIVFLTSLPLFQVNNEGEMIIHKWQYQAAAFGILLSCSLNLSQIGKIPRFGIYMLILGKVVKSFVMFMATFAAILVAFMLSFQILMPEKPEFNDNPWGFVRLLSMMSGEINYDSLFYPDSNDVQVSFPISTKLLFLGFIIIVMIILSNLLIGLTVTDIQGLQNEAVVSSLSIQVDEIHLMETFLLSDKLQELFKTFGIHHWLRYFLVTQQDNAKKPSTEVSIKIDETPEQPESILSSTEVCMKIDEIPKELRSDLKYLAAKYDHSLGILLSTRSMDSESTIHDDDDDCDYESSFVDSCDVSDAESSDDFETQLQSLSEESIQTAKVLKRRFNAMVEDFLEQIETQRNEFDD